jgi:hypothetical protein
MTVMPRLAALAPLAVLAWLGGCGAYGSIGLERREIAEYYSVAPQIRWNRFSQGDIEVWTVDGPLLDSLQFSSAIEEGDALYDIAGREELPLFRADMSEGEVMEFVVDSFASAGLQKVEAGGLAPASFGSRPGFRFDLAYQSAEGLDKLGTVLGMLADGRLYLIIYTGAAQHYFPMHKPTVEAVLASIQIGAGS